MEEIQSTPFIRNDINLIEKIIPYEEIMEYEEELNIEQQWENKALK